MLIMVLLSLSLFYFLCLLRAQERTGYMPPVKDPDVLERLKIIYGAMPATLSPEYAITERYTRLLKVNARASGRYNVKGRGFKNWDHVVNQRARSESPMVASTAWY